MILAVLIPTLFHLLSLPLIVWSFSAFFYSHTYSYYQILAYTISEDFYKLLLTYGLSVIAARFWFGGEQVEIKKVVELPSISFTETEPKIKESLKAQSAFLDKIVVSNGRNYIPISVNDILYFGAATPYIEIQLENKRYLHNETLKAINEKLDKKQFVRIHKSTIVNLNKVISYKSRLNGDYDLLLENKTEIRLSRNYAAEFKELFNRLSTG
jgi:DNA-binding LytR/AlgR family response regulator